MLLASTGLRITSWDVRQQYLQASCQPTRWKVFSATGNHSQGWSQHLPSPYWFESPPAGLRDRGGKPYKYCQLQEGHSQPFEHTSGQDRTSGGAHTRTLAHRG